VRFAKTLRSKLQREYEKLPHVQGNPFALAIADFHAPSSMVWSREALPSYLYGIYPSVSQGPEGRNAIGTPISKLLGKDEIPAGLFKDPAMSHLSGIIFSNAATLGKFNRMGFLAGWRPPGLTWFAAEFSSTAHLVQLIQLISVSTYLARNTPHYGREVNFGARN
jgi:hypothetical protein